MVRGNELDLFDVKPISLFLKVDGMIDFSHDVVDVAVNGIDVGQGSDSFAFGCYPLNKRTDELINSGIPVDLLMVV